MTLLERGLILSLLTNFIPVFLLILDIPYPLARALLAIYSVFFGLFTSLLVAFLVFVLVVLPIHISVTTWRTGRPRIPPCEQCGNLVFMRVPEIGEDVRACTCGRRYVRRGRQCLEVLPGGATIPYRRWRPFRRWVDDRAPHQTPAPAPYRGSDLPT